MISIIYRNSRNNKGRNKQYNNNSSVSVSCKCDSYGNCNSENCGYNSGDEYGDISKPYTDIEWTEVIIMILRNV